MGLFILGFGLVCYYSLHSLLANKKVKTYLIENWIHQKYYRLCYNFSAFLLLLPIYYCYKNIEATYFIENELIRSLGIGMGLLGGLLLILALSQYNLSEFAGTQHLNKASSLSPEKLKTSGFNAVVRHPLYFAILILIWGIFLFQPTDSILVISSVSTVYLYFGTKLEEEKLIAEFGNEYIEYKKNVRMLLPFLV